MTIISSSKSIGDRLSILKIPFFFRFHFLLNYGFVTYLVIVLNKADRDSLKKVIITDALRPSSKK